MTILTMVKYEWFEEWKDTTVRKRGDEYYNYKMRFAKNLFDWACTLFPKIKDKVRVQSRYMLYIFLSVLVQYLICHYCFVTVGCPWLLRH